MNGQPNLVCDGNANGNSGCGVVEWSRASYGPTFDAQGGGVFAMKWDAEGIAVCRYSTTCDNECIAHRCKGSFYRAAVPQDIVNSQPNPDNWGIPVAALAPQGCNPITNFVNHSIVFGRQFLRALLPLSLTTLQTSPSVGTGLVTRTLLRAALEHAPTT